MSTDNKPSVFERIRQMNEMFEVPINERFTDHGNDRLAKFHKITADEMKELKDCFNELTAETDGVAFADYLADQCVYNISEAIRWGIDLEKVLHAVIDSQESKLFDGKPVWNGDRSKFLKGPNFIAPDAAIAKIVYGK